MEDAITAFNKRRAVARCLVYDLERERTEQAFLIRELRQGRHDTTVADKRLSKLGSSCALRAIWWRKSKTLGLSPTVSRLASGAKPPPMAHTEIPAGE